MSYDQNKSFYSTIQAFSLVDILVGLALAGILLLGAITVSTKTTLAYTKYAELVKMSEIARFVFDYIGHRVRESGYWGCVKTLDNINNISTTTIPSDIEGIADSSDTTYTSDSLSLYGAETRGEPIRVTNVPANINAPIPVDNINAFSAGEVVLIANCEQGDIAEINSITNTDTEQTLNFDSLSNVYDTSSFVYPIETRTIRITNDGLVERSTQFINDTVLVENVARLNILYGIDFSIDNDGIANQYVRADQVDSVGSWDQVVSLRISIVVVSETSQHGSPTHELYVCRSNIPSSRWGSAFISSVFNDHRQT